MKKYRVIVEGTSYEVEIEEIKDASKSENKIEVKSTIKTKKTKNESVKTPAKKSEKKKIDEELSKEVVVAAEGEVSITAPMPGTILNVNVEVGQLVKSGDVLLILEAMKMENEIMAPKDGVIKSISVIKGSTVSAGGLMVIIK